MIDLDHVRSQSLSDVGREVYFNWSPTITPRNSACSTGSSSSSFRGHQPQLSPWTGREIFRYTVKGPGYSLAELKTAQDFVLERQFRQVPGVVDVVASAARPRSTTSSRPLRLKAMPHPDAADPGSRERQPERRRQRFAGRAILQLRGWPIRPGRHRQSWSRSQTEPVRVRDVAQSARSAPRLGIVGKDLERRGARIVLMRYAARRWRRCVECTSGSS